MAVVAAFPLLVCFRASWRGREVRAKALPPSASLALGESSSIKSTLDEEMTWRRWEELSLQVQGQFRSNQGIKALQFVDTLERLGIAYHFQDEIEGTLHHILDKKYERDEADDLFFTSLRFRLLRQHGHMVLPGVFEKFIDGKGDFNSSLSRDTWGMLSLYEASHLGTTGEDIVSKAMEFSANHLRTAARTAQGLVRREIEHALKAPSHMRMLRLEARQSIDMLEEGSFHPPELLEFAAIDFDIVQALHKSEVADFLRWWRDLGLSDKLTFVRDRPLEIYLWTVGMFWEPRYSRSRIQLSKAAALLYIMDDIFDIKGTMDELACFTKAIERWDLAAMDELPEYMKICYMALYTTTNEIAYSFLKEHGWNIANHLKRTWVDVCKSFLLEARWFSEGKVPALDDYLRNGDTSGGSHMALVHAFFLSGEQIREEDAHVLEPYPRLFSCAARILRLWDDLGTSKEEIERGDTASCIQCCIRQHEMSEEDARNYTRTLIHSAWKELNGELLTLGRLPLPAINASPNLARTTQAIYQYGDDATCPSVDDYVSYLLFNPICRQSFLRY